MMTSTDDRRRWLRRGLTVAVGTLLFLVGVWLSVRYDVALSVEPTPGATADDGRYLPAYRRVAGPQILMVYVGNSQCVWSEDASLPDAVERIKVRLAEQAEKQGMSFKAVGVALDWQAEAGLEHLENFGRFDEISSGYNWANTLALEYLWSDREVSPSTPQILVYERYLVAPRDSTDPLLYAEEGPRRILVKRGLAEIVDWAESGVSVPGS